ncbi:MAG: tetratricopeptide repeat protein, partial [Candidatus Anammoxibacter sp.]
FSKAIKDQVPVGNDSLLLTDVQPSAEDNRPSIVDLYYGLANTYKAMGKPEKGEQVLEKAIEPKSVNTSGFRSHSK